MMMLSLEKRTHRVLLILSLLLPLMMIISINSGYTGIGLGGIFRVLTGNGTAREGLILFQFRMPRIAIAMLVGMGFSLSGCVIQGITRNPLADPGILGINAGAGLVVMLFLVLNGTLGFASALALPFMAFVGAAATGMLIYILSYRRRSGPKPIALILNGIAIQAGINALMTLMVLQLDSTQHEFLAKWQTGSIWSSNWKLVVVLVPWIIIGIIILILSARRLDVLTMGDEISYGLGLKVGREKVKLLLTAVSLAAASVAISGSISFVGLIAPHLSRRLVGAKHSVLIPTCALMGALLVLTADTVARTIIQPSEIPTGIVVSVIGAPYFIYLLISQRRNKLKP